MYIYYQHNPMMASSLCIDDDNVKSTKYVPKWFESKHTFLWRMLTFRKGSFFRYELWKNNIRIATAEVVTYIPIFPFMKLLTTINNWGGQKYHIGPCATIPSERGKGYYPYLLQHIINDLGKENAYYMIIEENNRSSVRGVAKVGFVEIGRGTKTILGRYILTKSNI